MVYVRSVDPGWNNVDVTCNGERIPDWFAADDDAGLVVAYANGAESLVVFTGIVQVMARSYHRAKSKEN